MFLRRGNAISFRGNQPPCWVTHITSQHATFTPHGNWKLETPNTWCLSVAIANTSPGLEPGLLAVWMAWVDVLMLVDPGFQNHVKNQKQRKQQEKNRQYQYHNNFVKDALWQSCEWIAIIWPNYDISPTQIYLKYRGFPLLFATNLGGWEQSPPWHITDWFGHLPNPLHLKHSEKERSDPLASIIRDVLSWEKTLISQAVQNMFVQNGHEHNKEALLRWLPKRY